MTPDPRPIDARSPTRVIRLALQAGAPGLTGPYAPLAPHGLSTLLHLAYDPVLAAPASARIAALLRQLE